MDWTFPTNPEFVGASYSPIIRIGNVRQKELKPHDGYLAGVGQR